MKSSVSLKRILVIYRRSTYEIFTQRRFQLFGQNRPLPKSTLTRLKAAHNRHYQTLETVHNRLKKSGLSFDSIARNRHMSASRYDLVITVGGDGTFLDAARCVRRQVMLGVNSDRSRSVGQFCVCDDKKFGALIKKIARGSVRPKEIQRFEVRIEPGHRTLVFVNDVLICQKNPAAMSRYAIRVRNVREVHSGSGLWVATAAGSTGAILSAGGRKQKFTSKAVQFRARELYKRRVSYLLVGGVLPECRHLTIRSDMTDGMIYADGDRMRLPFRYGDTATIRRSEILKVIR